MEAYIGIRGSESAKICAYVSTSCHYEKKDIDTRAHLTSLTIRFLPFTKHHGDFVTVINAMSFLSLVAFLSHEHFNNTLL